MAIALAGGAVPHAHLEWWVPVLADGPFSTVAVSTGAGYTAVDIAAGYYAFSDFLDAFMTALNAAHTTSYAWAWAEGAAGERLVELTAGGGDPAISIQVGQSLRDLLGWASATTGLATTHTAASSPDGRVDALGARWETPQVVKDIQVTRYRHGRLVSAPWGSGTSYTLKARVDKAGLDRLLNGPLLTGRVRVESSVSSALSETYSGGRIDGYVHGFDKEPMDQREAYYLVTLRVLVPLAADRTSGLETDTTLEDTSFWGWLRYGFSHVHYARVEGIPFVWAELDLGWTSSDWTYHTGFVVDGGGRVGYEVDRRKGVGRSASMQFGILDPENTSDLFRRPAWRFTLAAELEHDDADVAVLQDHTAAPSSGKLYIGKECLEYSSKGAGTFQDIDAKRGTWGPIYPYRTSAVTTFRTVADVPLFWNGRIVEVWSTLVDPYGRPVDGAADGDHSRMVFLGEVEGNPTWQGAEGRWDFTAHSLERRLARQIGSEVAATIAGSSESTALQSRLVWLDTAQNRVTLYPCSSNGGTSLGGASELVIAAGGTVYTLGELVDKICALIVAQWAADFSLAVDVWANPDGWQEVAPGVISVTLATNGNGVELNGWVNVATTGGNGPTWLGAGINTTVYIGTAENLQAGALTIDLNGASGFGYYSLVIRENPPDYGAEVFPSSGYAVVEGDETELIHYDQKTAITSLEGGGVVYRLRVDKRGVDGTPWADLSKAGTVVRAATRLTGTLPEAILTILESSGIGDRGSYDTLANYGAGYGLSDAYVDEATIEALASKLSWAGSLALVLGKEYDADDLFGGLLAAHWMAFAPVRGDDGRLRIGLVRTLPAIVEGAKQITDAHLMGRRPVSPVKAQDGPTSVEIRMAETGIGESPQARRLFRSIEAILARGDNRWKFTWHGLAPMFYDLLAVHVARSLLERSEQFLTLDLQVSPWLDWQPGDAILLTTTHPGVYDYPNGVGMAGVSGVYGRVLGVKRNPETALCTLAVLLDGARATGVLCPGVKITGKSGDILNVDPAAAGRFVAGEGVIVYTPGYTASERTSLVVDSILGGAITMTTTPPAWVTAGQSVMTYRDQDVANARQGAYVHVDDGTAWS